MRAKQTDTGMNSRPERGAAMDAFLTRVGWVGAIRRPLAGDASFRRYERVVCQGKQAVLMDAPPPWEDVRPFIAITKHLEACDVTVPSILAADEAQGFLLLEDLGDALFTRLLGAGQEEEQKLYLSATDALVAIVKASAAHDAWSRDIKAYDMTVYLREAGLFVEWFLPQVLGIEKAKSLREEYLDAWRDVINQTPLKSTVLVHRDYHADNLLWLAKKKAHRAVGMLDYQDALWGDPAYDLVSLLEDARRDVDTATVEACYTHFIKALAETPDFSQRYAVLGAQRNAKIIGIFTRLCVRDGKAHYLDYLPRVWKHFLHDLTHPSLGAVRTFVDTHVPASWRGRFAADVTLGGIVP